MNWPSQIDYNDAVQNPSVCFSDADLKSGSVLLDKLGQPSVIAGGFANVYRLTSRDGHKWAVRCFTLHHEDSQERYSAISSFLQKERLPFMVDFTYQPKGIWVNSRWYPMLKMEWVDGKCLEQYIPEVLHHEPAKLLDLARAWKELFTALRSAGIAHGDLQHGNIMVTGAGDLKLVDYDDIFVPALRGKTSHGGGFPAYQHTGRSGSDFNENIDRFSALVIYLSIIALENDPSLLIRYDAFKHENILFRNEDYLSPENSALFRELLLSGNSQVKSLTAALQEACLDTIDAVPDLLALLSIEVMDLSTGNIRQVSSTEAATPIEGTKSTVLDSLDPQLERATTSHGAIANGIDNPILILKSPLIGDTWLNGFEYPIKWYFTNRSDTLRIDLLDGHIVHRVLTNSAETGLNNYGSIRWKIAGYDTKNRYRIRLISNDNSLISAVSDYFTICTESFLRRFSIFQQKPCSGCSVFYQEQNLCPRDYNVNRDGTCLYVKKLTAAQRDEMLREAKWWWKIPSYRE